MKQQTSGVIGVIRIDAGAFSAEDRCGAWRDDEKHLATVIGRLTRGSQGTLAKREACLSHGETRGVSRFPFSPHERETEFCTAHLARLAADLSKEFATFRMRVAEFEGDDAA
jgi:hypothetical protein